MYIILNLFVLDCLKSLTAPKQVIDPSIRIKNPDADQ